MRKIYAMSDIHGHYQEFIDALMNIDLNDKENKLILLGDYIDNGMNSKAVIEKIMTLEKEYPEQIITLLGNHDEFLINWLLGLEDCYIDDKTLVSFFTIEDLTGHTVNDLRTTFIKKYPHITHWLKRKNKEQRYYETDNQIFVHAGIWETEEDQEYWKSYTPDENYTNAYPPKTGSFYKDIIAGHVYSHEVSGDKAFLGRIYHDNESHYYIDGDVQRSGFIPILVYDTETKLYSFIEK
ncbi:metallophosphoesterase [Macrococcus capreoli]|uniref:metallophosphoesterase n=1 Tax=Macrococcus capreoli TaxID=2982690 RepID=UPI003EE7450E